MFYGAQMDAAHFLGLTPTHNPYRWHLPVVPGIATAGDFLFGGCGLGAAIAAMESASGRPVIWATAQYLNYAKTHSVVDIDVKIAVSGRNTTQARAVGHVEDTEIFTVNAALGDRDMKLDETWVKPLDVPEPDACAPRPLREPGQETIMSRLDLRLACAKDWADIRGNPTNQGRSALWARLPESLEPSAGTLAILGDYVPFGIGQALGELAGGNSLDNTIRILKVVPTEWVLLDIQVDGIARGFGHGTVHLWASDGALMATASQSTIVRYWQLPPQEK